MSAACRAQQARHNRNKADEVRQQREDALSQRQERVVRLNSPA